jgi:hypothetical protein
MMSPVDFSMITTAETLRIDARMLPSAMGLDSVSSDSLPVHPCFTLTRWH